MGIQNYISQLFNPIKTTSNLQHYQDRIRARAEISLHKYLTQEYIEEFEKEHFIMQLRGMKKIYSAKEFFQKAIEIPFLFKNENQYYEIERRIHIQYTKFTKTKPKL